MAGTAAPESLGLAWVPPGSFDQFVILRPLGRGGMGHVYLGRDRALDRLVALKFISSRNPSAASRERFLVEARAIARLSHPNVVGVYTIGEAIGRPYIAYEFVAGHSLDRLAVPLAWQTVLRLSVGAARGLEAAHREGILHRDLKPGNIILSDRGEVKLLDFGLAKLEEPIGRESGFVIATHGDVHTQDSTVDGSSDSGEVPLAVREPPRVVDVPIATGEALTRPGVLMGTPAYMAPELWTGETATQRSDVFALGLVMYELLAGRLPHASDAPEEIARRLMEEGLPPVRSAQPEIPESFAAVVDRAVRRDPAERYPSAAELRAALEELQRVFLPTSADGRSTQELDPERIAVAASFARIRESGDGFVSGVYDRLFASDPNVRALFPVDLSAQKKKLLHMLGLAIGAVDEPERVGPVLEDLGRRHLHYSVEPRHFRVLEDALVGALSEHDPSWSPELERGWRRSFAVIETSMTRGMESERGTFLTEDPVTVARWPRAPEPKTPIPADVRTRYAANGDVTLAYQVFGEGPPSRSSIDIVVLLGWITHVELNWQHPTLANFLGRLAQLGRVIVFDKRGTGLSDRVFETASLQDRIDDIRTVLDHAGVTRPVFLGVSEGAAVSALFGALHPDRTRGLVLFGGTPRMLLDHDFPHGLPPQFLDHVCQEIRARWGEALFVEAEAPSMAHDESFREWLALYFRMSASPGNAINMLRMNASFDIRAVLPSIRVPTLVMHRKGDRVAPFGGGKHLGDNIPGARFVALEGDDHVPFVGDTDAVLGEIHRFLAKPLDTSETAPLRIVLVAAAREATSVADIDRVVGPIAARHRGETLAMLPDGVALQFDGAGRAARAALAIATAAHRAGLPIGIALDAAAPAASVVESTAARARDGAFALPTASALVRELAATLGIEFVPIASTEGSIFAIEPSV